MGADYHRAFDMTPGSWDIKCRLALVHSAFGQQLFNSAEYSQAAVEFSTAIEYNPKVSSFFLYRGHAYYYQHRFTSASLDYEHALSLDPSCQEAQRRLEQFGVSGLEVHSPVRR